MKKSVRILEVVSSLVMVLSKYFLSKDNNYGWILSIIGYMMVVSYNSIRKIFMLAILSAGLLVLSIYGWYKWNNQFTGLQTLDYVIIAITLSINIYLGFNGWRNKKDLWWQQIVASLCSMSGFILLGLQIILFGWFSLLFSHLFIGYTHYKKSDYVYVLVQILSFGIALKKIIEIVL